MKDIDQAKCKKYIVFLALILFVTAYGSDEQKKEKEDEQEKTPIAVDIKNEKGEIIGRFEESETGEELMQIKGGHETLPWSYEDEVKQELLSPDKRNIAKVYIRNCNATTDYATRVDLISTSNDPNLKPLKVLILESYQPVNVEWSGSDKLIIDYPPMEKELIFVKESLVSGIEIEYRNNLYRGPESQYIDFSSFNYGVTGMAAGFSEEELLRIAGWSQMKSGLYKSEWGTWYGDEPYGDDPRGHNMIKQGIELYYKEFGEKKEQ
ncbi:MAG: polymorphic toxin type 44 domain-containing protein [Phycisphaerae bacterium]|jgi:hypothetical protein